MDGVSFEEFLGPPLFVFVIYEEHFLAGHIFTHTQHLVYNLSPIDRSMGMKQKNPPLANDRLKDSSAIVEEQ